MGPQGKKLMTRVVTGARVVLGLILLLSGVHGIFGFPAFRPEPAFEGEVFLRALAETGYLGTLRGSLELLCAGALLAGRCVPLGLALAVPLLGNALAYHLFLDPDNVALAATATGLHAFLVYAYWPYYRSLLLVQTPSRFAPTGSWRLTGNRAGKGPDAGAAPKKEPAKKEPAKKAPAKKAAAKKSPAKKAPTKKAA